jgi:hypothetical protein
MLFQTLQTILLISDMIIYRSIQIYQLNLENDEMAGLIKNAIPDEQNTDSLRRWTL